MTPRSRSAFLLCLLALASPAAAQEGPDSHRQAARTLLEVTNSRALAAQSARSAAAMTLAQYPAADTVAGLDSLLERLLTRYLDWNVLEPEFIQLYVDVFSESELRQLIAFYRSPLGEKLLARMPEVIQRSMAITQRRMEQSGPLIQEDVRRFMAARRSKR